MQAVAKLAAKYNSTFCYEAGPTRYGRYRLMTSLATSAWCPRQACHARARRADCGLGTRRAA